jgi:hypothetical protein
VIGFWFIFWGSKDRIVRRGIVVDVCPECQALQPFVIVDYFSVPHVYFIGLGRGSYVGSTRACFGCHTEITHEPYRYADVLPLGALEEVSLDVGLERTNPTLKSAFDKLQKLEDVGAGSYREAGVEVPTDLIPQLVRNLRMLLWQGHDVGLFTGRFEAEHPLSASALLDLAAEVRGYLAGLGIAPGAA